MLAAALGVGSSTAAEATRERELARRLSDSYAPSKRPGGDVVPKGLERVKQEVELPHARQMGTRLTTSEQRSTDELARFYLERGQRLFQQENDRDAMVELNHAIYLSPYLADAHLLLGRSLLRTGRVHEAIDAFKIALWSAETADGACGARRGVPAGQESRGGARGSGARPRARSRRRPTPGSCWRGSKGANVLKSRWLWRNRSRTKAFTKSS